MGIQYLIWITVLMWHPLPQHQSPYTNVNLRMDSVLLVNRNYKIEMKLCQLVVKSDRGNWLTHDTSRINFEALKADSIVCGKYMENGEGTERIQGNKTTTEFNAYSYQNQLMAWEDILVFEISDYSSRAWHQPMYLVLPIRYKSFITNITITDIVYRQGTVIYLEGKDAFIQYGQLNYQYSLRGKDGIPVKNFFLAGIL